MLDETGTPVPEKTVAMAERRYGHKAAQRRSERNRRLWLFQKLERELGLTRAGVAQLLGLAESDVDRETGNKILRRLKERGIVPLCLTMPVRSLDSEPEGPAPDDFVPERASDPAERTLAWRVPRPTQPDFRRRLLIAYGCRCAVSGCDVESALEAAHIIPFPEAKADSANHIQNGLLLRADIHKLFDLGLISVDCDVTAGQFRIVVAPGLQASDYGQFHGTALLLPGEVRKRPSEDALRIHRRERFVTGEVASSKAGVGDMMPSQSINGQSC